MAEQAKQRRAGRPSGIRGRRPVAPVPEPEAAEYVFELLRCLMAITRDHRDLRMTTYFLEMAAMEIAPRMKARRTARRAQESRRATS